MDLCSSTIDTDYCIKKCADWISAHSYQTVGLEFCDNYENAPAVSQLIKEKVGFSPYVLSDTNRACGDCCVDERTALPRNIDAVIHYGRTCLTPTNALPVLYVQSPPSPFSAASIVNRLQQDNGPKFDEQLILVYDVAYAYAIDALADMLRSTFKNFVVSSLIIPSGAEIIYPSCSEDSINMNVTHLPHTADATFSLVNNNGKEEEGMITVKFNVRQVQLPVNCNIKDYNFIYIGARTSSLTALQLKFAESTFYQVDSVGNTMSVSDFTKNIMSRSKKIEQVKEAKIIGILFTLIKGHGTILSHLKKLIKSAGKKCYCFFMGKINEPKLGNIVGVDIFVYVTCPESSIFDRNDNVYIYQKVVAPWEVEVALNPSFEWSLNFETNFWEFVSEDTLEDTVKMCSLSDKDVDREKTSFLPGTVATRPSGTLSRLHENAAGEVLQSLSWKGLNPDEESLSPIGTIVEGRKGIASSYSNESVS